MLAERKAAQKVIVTKEMTSLSDQVYKLMIEMVETLKMPGLKIPSREFTGLMVETAWGLHFLSLRRSFA